MVLSRIKSLHLKIAFFIAPILMIGGWGLAETFWNYQNPQYATTKRPYTLCDLANDDCTLKQQGLTLEIKPLASGTHKVGGLALTSSTPLSKVLIAIAAVNKNPSPLSLQSTDGLTWRTSAGALVLPAEDPGNLMLRMVVIAAGKEYIGEMTLRY